MFDKQDINEYQKIKAPIQLKARIKASCYQNNDNFIKRLFRFIGLKQLALAAVACMVLVISFSAFRQWNSPDFSVMINGNEVNHEVMEIPDSGIAVAAFSERMVSSTNVPMEINVDGKTRIYVLSGNLQVFNPVTGELLYTGNEYETKEDVMISWNVNGETKAGYEMYVKSRGRTEKYILTYNYANGKWVICKE